MYKKRHGVGYSKKVLLKPDCLRCWRKSLMIYSGYCFICFKKILKKVKKIKKILDKC